MKMMKWLFLLSIGYAYGTPFAKPDWKEQEKIMDVYRNVIRALLENVNDGVYRNKVIGECFKFSPAQYLESTWLVKDINDQRQHVLQFTACIQSQLSTMAEQLKELSAPLKLDEDAKRETLREEYFRIINKVTDIEATELHQAIADNCSFIGGTSEGFSSCASDTMKNVVQQFKKCIQQEVLKIELQKKKEKEEIKAELQELRELKAFFADDKQAQ